MLPHFDISLEDYINSDSYELIFDRTGVYDYKMTNDVIEELQEKLIEQKLDRPSLKRLFGIIVESLENAFRHSVEQNEKLNHKVNILIYLLRYGKNYKLVVGNFIDKEECVSLCKRFDKILDLEKRELQELCIDRMKKGFINIKGGGGLGILDIAIRSEGNLILKSFPAKGDNQLFLLEANIKASKIGGGSKA